MRSDYDEVTLTEVDAFYERVHGIMERRGLEWKDLARRMGLDECTLSLMRSSRNVPDSQTVRKIADALGVALDELFDSSGNVDFRDTYWASSRLQTERLDSAPPFFYAREVAYYKVDEDDGKEPGDDVVYVEEIRERKDGGDEEA